MISLFYRAWEKCRVAILVEQCRYGPGRQEPDLFSFALFCLVGLGTAGQRRRIEFDEDLPLYYAGHFSHRPATACACRAC